MYLLDTKHFSRLILGDSSIRRHITEVGEQNIAINVTTQGEVPDKAYDSEKRDQNLALVQAYVGDVGIYRLNDAIVNLYGQSNAELIRHFGPKERQKRRKTKIENIGTSDNASGLPTQPYHIRYMRQTTCWIRAELR